MLTEIERGHKPFRSIAAEVLKHGIFKGRKLDPVLGVCFWPHPFRLVGGSEDALVLINATFSAFRIRRSCDGGMDYPCYS